MCFPEGHLHTSSLHSLPPLIFSIYATPHSDDLPQIARGTNCYLHTGTTDYDFDHHHT
jgi:hypothetical protein